MWRAAMVSLVLPLLWSPEARAQDDSDPLAVPGDDSASGSASASGAVSADLGGEPGAARGFGVGAVGMMGELGTPADPDAVIRALGPALLYDAGKFHIEGILAYGSFGDLTTLGLGGRFWYHVHQSENADFSVGGGLGLLNLQIRQGGPDESYTIIDLEGGAQIRYFLVPNVALSAALGLVVLAGDANDLNQDRTDLTGDLTGSSGISYYF